MVRAVKYVWQEPTPGEVSIKREVTVNNHLAGLHEAQNWNSTSQNANLHWLIFIVDRRTDA